MPNSLGELVGSDLADYTQGRLDGDDDATKAALVGALAAARRFCGWHVTPVRTTQVVTLDGPGSPLLVLPTLHLTALTALTEDGVTADLGTVRWSQSGLVRKDNGSYWSHRFGAITATISHGFADANDFNAAVLSLADRASFAGVGGKPTVVGPFQYGTDTSSLFSDSERSTLQSYRLESQA